jgi:YidC/Oxa1 family membrane protein insertase
MAQSQKYMMYIVPFFSLTGLYWQYGLVLYWVTTNVWTLGQQYIMFRNWTVEPTGAAGATAAATTGTPVRTTQSSLRAGSGTAKTSADGKRSGTAGAKSQSGGARAGSASSQKASTSPRPAAAGNGSGGTGNGSAGNGSGGAGNGSGGARTGADRRPATVTTTPVQPPVQASSQNGGEKRGLLRLGRQKPEPAPEPEVPTTRVVRQQPVRQAKSKRSGNKR